MDKIRELCKEMGASEAFADKLLEAIDAKAQSVKEGLLADYKAKLEKAKEVCIESVAQYKAQLAKKVQIFCESKALKIEEQVNRQMATRETAAQTKLNQIVALLEGIQTQEINETVVKKLQAQLEAYKTQAIKESQEKQAALNKVNEITELATKLLSQNKALKESQIAAAAPVAAPVVPAPVVPAVSTTQTPEPIAECEAAKTKGEKGLAGEKGKGETTMPKQEPVELKPIKAANKTSAHKLGGKGLAEETTAQAIDTKKGKVSSEPITTNSSDWTPSSIADQL